MGLFLSLGLSTACVSDPVTGESRLSTVQWTAQQERDMGREFSPNIESEFDAIYPDTEANAYLGKLVERMVSLSPRKDDFEFHFKILNSSTPNAFALPGGYVYVTRGLLAELHTEGQFISVMGHELGHVEHRHAMLNQGKIDGGGPGRLLGRIGRALPLGGGIVNTAAGIISAPSALLGLSFSRSQELEADERGVFFAATMGYDPRDAEMTFEMFQRLEEESDSDSATPAIFRTHPLNEDRIDGIEELIEDEYPDWASKPRAETIETSDEFAAIVTGLRKNKGAYGIYQATVKELSTNEDPDLGAARQALAGAMHQVPNEPLFRILDGELAIMEEDVEAAIQRFAEAVSIYDQHVRGDGHWKPPFYLGLIATAGGEYDIAISQLTVAKSRYPMNPSIHFVLGNALAGGGDSAAAEEAYDTVLELAPSGSDLHQQAKKRRRAL